MLYFLAIFLLIVVPISPTREGEFKEQFQLASNDWSYDDVNWPGLCSTGKRQSPINIDWHKNIGIKSGNLNTNDFNKERVAYIQNNGYTVLIDFPDDEILLNSTYFDGIYKLDNVHYHWGAEHTFNNYRYQMEIHLVFFDKKFNSIAEAIKHENYVAVIGVLVKETNGPCRNNAFATIANQMNQIKYYNNKKEVRLTRPINVADFMPNKSLLAQYFGSLTTPGCDEGVQWFVKLTPIKLCTEHVKTLTTLYDDKGKLLTKTYRPVQPLNGRKVNFTL